VAPTWAFHSISARPFNRSLWAIEGPDEPGALQHHQVLHRGLPRVDPHHGQRHHSPQGEGGGQVLRPDSDGYQQDLREVTKGVLTAGPDGAGRFCFGDLFSLFLACIEKIQNGFQRSFRRLGFGRKKATNIKMLIGTPSTITIGCLWAADGKHKVNLRVDFYGH